MRTSALSASFAATTHLTRRNLLRVFGVASGSVVASILVPPGRSSASTPVPGMASPVASASLAETIAEVMQKPRYAKSNWNILVADVATGETLYELNPDQMALTGSVRKLFSVGLALKEVGADHRFTTPVYRQGDVDVDGVLSGNLILVAAGDLTLGGRLNADGTILYTDFDHNDANNLGTAILAPQDPLHGLDDLARQVRASGIRAVTGDVLIDDRLFDSFRVPNQNLLITPIMVNENMIDVTVTPTQVDQPASIAWRPETAAFSVTGTVRTTAVGTPDTVALSDDGLVQCIGEIGCSGTVEGDIPIDYRAPLSDSTEMVQTFRIEDPAAFARIAFIEALKRAGVTVQAPLITTDTTGNLPASDAYVASTRVAEFVSPPYSEYARLILKVSLNLGANLSLMLFGLTQGKRTITGALAAERQTLVDSLGIQAGAFHFPTNGSGSPDSQASPRATVRLLTEMGKTSDAGQYKAALPILGVDGSLAHSGTSLPARGHVFAKTGTTLDDTGLKAQTLAGYIDALSGRKLAFAVFLNDAGPVESISDVTEVFEDEAVITNAIYESS